MYIESRFEVLGGFAPPVEVPCFNENFVSNDCENLTNTVGDVLLSRFYLMFNKNNDCFLSLKSNVF